MFVFLLLQIRDFHNEKHSLFCYFLILSKVRDIELHHKISIDPLLCMALSMPL